MPCAVSYPNTSLPTILTLSDVIDFRLCSLQRNLHYSDSLLSPPRHIDLFSLPILASPCLFPFLPISKSVLETTRIDPPSDSDTPHSPHTCSSPYSSPPRPQAHASSAPDPWSPLYLDCHSFLHTPDHPQFHFQHHYEKGCAGPLKVTGT
jgi:hypothetical protein